MHNQNYFVHKNLNAILLIRIAIQLNVNQRSKAAAALKKIKKNKTLKTNPKKIFKCSKIQKVLQDKLHILDIALQ